MKKILLQYIFLFLFLASQMNSTTAQSMQFSSKLNEGDTFYWRIDTNYEDDTGYFEDDSLVELKIIDDPDKVQISELEDIANLLELKFGDTVYDFSWDDILLIFIVPTQMEDDGEMINLAENQFIYVVYDDLLFNGIPIETQTEGDIVSQSANYTDGDVTMLIHTSIDKSTGIMQSVTLDTYKLGSLTEYMRINQTDTITEPTNTAGLPFFDSINVPIFLSLMLSYSIARNYKKTA